MTQNKKFKKQVRARMKETGETYMQARRALLNEQPEQKGPWSGGTKYKLIGYWKSIQEPHYPDPMLMVDPSWDPTQRKVVLEYLRRAPKCRLYFGHSWCRLGCGQTDEDPKGRTVFDGPGTDEGTWEERRDARKKAATRAQEANMTAAEQVDMGTAEQTDGVYVWPEGLAHYVAEHNVRLPKEFVNHVLADPTRFHRVDVDPGDPEKNFVTDERWWRSIATTQRAKTAKKELSIEEIRKVLHTTWHKVYHAESMSYHVYENGPEDGRWHTSLCGDATTKVLTETPNPGAPDCEMCKLLKVKGIIAKQKVIGDPLNILHDPELWAAAGGTEEDRIAQRDELWGSPPDVEAKEIPRLKQLMQEPSVLELEMPFPKGWYFHYTEYPEEGSEGPYETLADAKQAAQALDDPESVSFSLQKERVGVVQRYLIEHLREEIAKVIQETKGKTYNLKLRSALEKLLTAKVRKVMETLKGQGVEIPGQGFQIDLADITEDDLDRKQVRAKVTITEPERYADFIRELTDSGILEPQYMLSVQLSD